jgi:paired small multidrug resistance pump
MPSLFVAIGFVGVVIVLLAYGLLTLGKLSGDDWRYPVLNIVGTLGIVVSLFAQFNLPSMVTQLMWIAVSIIGLMRIARKRNA